MMTEGLALQMGIRGLLATGQRRSTVEKRVAQSLDHVALESFNHLF